MEVMRDEFEEAREELEKAYAASPDAESFLREILRIWAEHGFIPAEMQCRLDGREAV